MTLQTESRQVKGLAIVALGSQIKRINKISYEVKSQSNGIWYSVVRKYGETGKRQGGWTCACPDHLYRQVQCKHIYAVLFSKQLRKKIVSQDVGSLIEIPYTETSKCPKCNSSNIVKNGARKTKYGSVQRYRCKDCMYRFIINYGFEGAKASPKAITAALDLYFKGISLRKVCDHLKQFYGTEVSHMAVSKWIRKFVKVVRPYVDQLVPQHLSGIYHVDEMMIHVRKEKMEMGHYQWLWNLMDNTTRFWICTKVSQRREIADARAIFQEAKSKVPRPHAVVHDGHPSYDKAFQKEFFTLKKPRTMNIRSVSVRHEGLNSKVERLHGSIRDREVVMRGMDHAESAQELMEAMRIYHNFCREHSTLGKTPAEMAGIHLSLNDNRIEGLIKHALQFKRDKPVN